MKPYPTLLAELLSRELSSLRRQKALTQEAMAEQLRISSRAYSDLERGKYTASAPTLMFLFPCWMRKRRAIWSGSLWTVFRHWRRRMQHECRNGHRRSL